MGVAFYSLCPRSAMQCAIVSVQLLQCKVQCKCCSTIIAEQILQSCNVQHILRFENLSFLKLQKMGIWAFTNCLDTQQLPMLIKLFEIFSFLCLGVWAFSDCLELSGVAGCRTHNGTLGTHQTTHTLSCWGSKNKQGLRIEYWNGGTLSWKWKLIPRAFLKRHSWQ